MSGKKLSILLISDDLYWIEAVEESLASSDLTVDATFESSALEMVRDRLAGENAYALVIVDVMATENTSRLVGQIRQQQSEARIVVATAAPTWQLAREVFRAGAMDCVRKSLSKRTLHTLFAGILSRVLPS